MRIDLVQELEECWKPYAQNTQDGVAAATMGAQLVVARYELYPNACSRNRMCPNCTMQCPKTLLSCPQCKGSFISSGVVNRSAPSDVLLTKEEIDRMVREREETLKETSFPKEDEIENQEAIIIPDEPPEETFPAGNVNMEEQTDDTIGAEPGDAVIDVDDAYTSTAINIERLKADLIEYSEKPAFSIDPNDRISRYMLFKIADFVINAFPTWYKFMFVETDKSRAVLLSKGIRHDITGNGHATMKSDTGVDGFDMERGIPTTVDDETARNHYQAKFEANTSKYDGEEMVRRYRFSVIITKLIEVLYRWGYDLEGEFKTSVKMCNSASEDQDTETTNPRTDILLAIGTVERAMGEAIN